MRKSILVAVFMLAGFAPLVNSQVVSPHGWNSALNRAMAGPTAEYYTRRMLAPADYAANNYGSIFSGRGVVGGIVDGAVAGGSMGVLVQTARDGNIAKGAWVGGAIGGAVGGGIALLTSRHSRGATMADAYNGRRGNKGESFILANQTRYTIVVFFGKGKGKRLGQLASGETWSVKGPKPGESYSGYVLIPNRDGGFSSDEVPIQPVPNGWVFVEPDCVRQGGR